MSETANACAEREAMRAALAIAAQVAEGGNVPVGAVILVDGKVVAKAGNLRETLQDPTAHAEILALSAAGQRLGSWRLEQATLVVTLEPCAMCAHAIVQARVGRVVYALTEPKTGAHQSVHRAFEGQPIEVIHDPQEAASSQALLTGFFASLRKRGAG